MTLVPLLLQAIPRASSCPKEVFVQLKTGGGVRKISRSGLVIVWVNVKTKGKSEIAIFLCKFVRLVTATLLALRRNNSCHPAFHFLLNCLSIPKNVSTNLHAQEQHSLCTV